MKFIAIVVLALIAVVSCDPIQISDNNVGDIITVGISAKADISNNIDTDIVNVIVALLRQNVDDSNSAVPLVEESEIEVGEPEMVEFVPLVEAEESVIFVGEPEMVEFDPLAVVEESKFFVGESEMVFRSFEETEESEIEVGESEIVENEGTYIIGDSSPAEYMEVPMESTFIGDAPPAEYLEAQYIESPIEVELIGDSPPAEYREAAIVSFFIGDVPPAQYLEEPIEMSLNGDSPPIEDLDEELITQEALDHFVRVLPAGFQL